MTTRHCERSEAIQAPQVERLLRGACHRARIRATRWLAMTAERANAFSRRDAPEVCYSPCPFCQSNCAEVARRSAGLKAGADAPPPTAATALTPPVHRSVGFASARSRTERGRGAFGQLST